MGRRVPHALIFADVRRSGALCRVLTCDPSAAAGVYGFSSRSTFGQPFIPQPMN